MKKVLIIGGSSNIGRKIIPVLDNNIDYTYYKNKIEGGIYFDLINDNIEDVVDINDYSTIILLSALSKLDDCLKNTVYSNSLNVDSMKRIINTFLKIKVKIIFFSTEFIFDGQKGNYSEIDEPNPINLYGKQKLAIENYLKENSSDYCILRIAKTYSSSFNDDTLFAGWYDMVFNRKVEEIKCFSDQYFSPLYIHDLCLTLQTIIKKDIIGIINLGGPKKHSRIECLETFLSIFNCDNNVNVTKQKLSTIDSNENWPLDVSFNTRKLKNLIDFQLMTIESVCKLMKEQLYEKI